MEQLIDKIIVKNYSADNFDIIYKNILRSIYYHPEFILNTSKEIANLSFELTNPLNNLVTSKIRNFNSEFAEKFFKWTWDGKSDMTELFDVNKNAKNFHSETEGRNTAYGPRIVKQLPYIIDELKRDSDSRRAVINILEADDKEILEDKFTNNNKTEFPCTNAITFFIRDNKLNIHVAMRSNNMVLTICYDVYNFANMLFKVHELLKDTYPNLEIGTYYHNIVSSHILEKEYELTEKILDEYNND